MLSGFTHRLRQTTSRAAFFTFCTLLAFQAKAQFVAQNTNFPNASTGVSEIVVVDISTVWATGYDGSGGGGVFKDVTRTSTGGLNWIPRTLQGTASDAFSHADLFAFDASHAWAAMVDQTNGGGELYETTNGGTTWSRRIASRFTGTTSYLNAVHFFSPTVGVVMGDPLNGEFEMYRTTDGGVTWTPQAATSLPNPLTGEFSYTKILKGVGQSGWFGTSQGRVYRTVNAGSSWTVATTGLADVNLLSFSTATDGIAVDVNASGGIVGMARTTNGGVSWSVFTPSGTVFASDVQAVLGSDGYYVSVGAVTGASGSSFSRDYGQTWTLLEGNVQRTAVGCADASTVWVGNFTSTTNTGGILKGSLPNATPLDPPPAWAWVRGAGTSTGSDFAFSTATDANGNVYVAGRYVGSTTIGGFTLTSNGGIDGYLAKFNAAGVGQWAVTMGGLGGDQLRAVTVDASGNVYAAGVIQGQATINPIIAGTGTSDFDAVIIRYDATTGEALWARTGGGIGFDEARAIGTDGSGNVYVGGTFDSTNTFFGTTNLTHGGRTDGFAASYSSLGAMRWARGFSSNSNDEVTCLAVRGSGNVVFGGFYGDSGVSNFLQVGTTTLTSAGGTDGFLANYSGTGTLNWARVVGGSDDDFINGVAMNTTGTVYAIGEYGRGFAFGSSILPTPVSTNAVVFNYSSTGVEGWSNVMSSNTEAQGAAITRDASDNLYVTGYHVGTTQFGSGQLTSGGISDIYVSQITSSGVTRWITSAGGTGAENSLGISVDATGQIYVAGVFNSPIISFGTQSQTFVGGIDGFLAKLGSACAVSTPTLSSNGPICSGQQLTLTGSNVDAGTTSVITGPNSYSVPSSSGTISNASTAASGTYTLTVTLAPGCSATATTSVVVNALPSVPTVSPVTLCGPGSATLIAGNVPVGGSIGWYNTSTGTVPFFTGSSYTTPTLSATTTYWVRAISASSCRSNAVSVTVTVNGSGVPPTISFNGATEFCQGGSLVLTGTGGGLYLWSNGSTGNSITVSASGTYTVSTALSGCTLTSAPVVVTVRPLPSTPATTDASNCGPGSVTLTASGGAANDVYNWYDVATGGAPIASGSSYTTPVLNATRVYYAELVRTGCASATRSSATANILPAASASLSAQGSTTLCPGDSVRLNATGSAGSWQYYRSGGLVPSGTNQSLVVRDSGTYFVVATQGTCTAISNSIRVNLNAAPAAAQVVPAERCGPGSVALTASGAPANGSYAWYTAPTGGSPIVGANGATYNTPVLAANTTYYVAIVDPSLTCPAPRVPVLAGINSVPTVSLVATGPTTFCRGDSVKLLGNSIASVTYQFNRSGLPIQGANATSLVVRDSGTYSITVTTAQNCSATSSTIRVNVNPAGDATFAYATSTLCLGGTGSVLPTISGTPGGTFSASPSGLVIDASSGAIALSGSQPNTYVVSYQVSGICPATRSQVITVTAAPSATFSYAQSSGCAGSTGTIVPSFASGSSAGVFSSTTGLVIDPVSGAILLVNSQPGTYTVLNTIAASGTCPGTVATASFTVNPAPATPTINSQTQGNGILLTSSAAAGNQWFLNGNPVPGGTGQTLLVNDPANNGTYTLQVTANGCTSAFSAGSVVTITGIADGLGSLKLTLAPNPTSDGRTQLKLTGARMGETVQIRVLDALGRVVYTATPVAEATETLHELNLSMLPKGLYTVHVSTSSRVLTQALIQE